jgi:hypothetical protein
MPYLVVTTQINFSRLKKTHDLSRNCASAASPKKLALLRSEETAAEMARPHLLFTAAECREVGKFFSIAEEKP